MSWASERRAIILSLIFGVLFVIAAGTLFSVLYETPSCMDGRQNAEEDGVDCGGSCAYLCTASVTAPKVEFVRALRSSGGRTDIVAYVENPNANAAAREAKFHIELYGANRELLAETDGTIDLPSATNIPIFLPNVYSGPADIASTFLSFEDASLQWFLPTGELFVPIVTGERITETDMPRITATIENLSAEPMLRVPVVATVFDGAGNAIAASRTIVSVIPAQGTAPLVFTWSEPFSATPGKIEIRPVIELAP